MDADLLNWLQSTDVQNSEELVDKLFKLKIVSVYQLGQSFEAQQLAKENMTKLSKKRFDIDLNSFLVNYLSRTTATRNKSKRLKVAFGCTNALQQRNGKEANNVRFNNQQGISHSLHLTDCRLLVFRYRLSTFFGESGRSTGSTRGREVAMSPVSAAQ